MQRRHPERRVGCPLPAALDHVGGRVAPVNVEACFAQGGEQPSCATAGVEDGAAEVLPVEVELGRVDVDERPVIGDEAVMPCAWCVHVSFA